MKGLFNIFSFPDLSSQAQQSMKRKALSRRAKAEALTGAMIEGKDHSLEFQIRDGGEIKFFREILTKQAVCILV